MYNFKQDDKLQQIYKSSIKGSYFCHLKQNSSTNKSKIQIEQSLEKVDQNTFRILQNFSPPDNKNSNFTVFQKTGRFHIEPSSLFSCFTNRQSYDVQIINTKMMVTSKNQIKYFFDFNLIDASIRNEDDYFILKIQGLEKKFYFEPTKKSENLQSWIVQLMKIIQMSDGRKSRFTYLAKNTPQFYQKQYISNNQFEKSANTCDIILFRSEHSAARVQRLFTGSDYDHVGILLRNRKNELYVLESTSNQGVGLTPWRHIVKYKWYESTEKIVWRRLKIKLQKKQYDIIERFLILNLGKGFELSMQKLLKMQSKFERTDEQQRNKTYFCSQLIARLYKQLYLLPSDISCAKFYPVDFSSLKKIQFIKSDIVLENQKIISFQSLS